MLNQHGNWKWFNAYLGGFMGFSYGSWRFKNKKVRRKCVYGQNRGYGWWRFAIGKIIVTKWEARLWSEVGVGLGGILGFEYVGAY